MLKFIEESSFSFNYINMPAINKLEIDLTKLVSDCLRESSGIQHFPLFFLVSLLIPNHRPNFYLVCCFIYFCRLASCLVVEETCSHIMHLKFCCMGCFSIFYEFMYLLYSLMI